MTKEELRKHCEKQVRMCEEWAKGNDREPSGKIYEEHKLILDLINALEQQPSENCEYNRGYRDGYDKGNLNGYEIRKAEEKKSDDCVSRQAVLDILSHYAHNFGADNEIKSLPPVTPTHCIAAVRFSKDDLREICNERIEVECTHGTCKECKHWKDSDGEYRRGIYAESKCPINIKEVYEGNFYCKWFEKRGDENGSN